MATTTGPLTVDHPLIREFLAGWHEDGRASFELAYRYLDYDSDAYAKRAKGRRKYIALDRGTSGVYLVDRMTGEVYTIKAYGVPNRRIGHIEQVIAARSWAR